MVCTAGPADVRATLKCLVDKLQRFCNTKTQSPPSVKLVLVGGDTFINSLLRPYVEVFSSKPPDWQSYVRFYVVSENQNSCELCVRVAETDGTGNFETILILILFGALNRDRY